MGTDMAPIWAQVVKRAARLPISESLYHEPKMKCMPTKVLASVRPMRKRSAMTVGTSLDAYMARQKMAQENCMAENQMRGGMRVRAMLDGIWPSVYPTTHSVLHWLYWSPVKCSWVPLEATKKEGQPVCLCPTCGTSRPSASSYTTTTTGRGLFPTLDILISTIACSTLFTTSPEGWRGRGVSLLPLMYALLKFVWSSRGR